MATPYAFQPFDMRPITQETALLRLLLRLEFVTARHLHLLIYPDRTRRSVTDVLHRLHARRLIWRKAIDSRYLPDTAGRGGTIAPIRPMLYGLTPDGRDAVAPREPDPDALHRAIVRDWRDPEVKLSQLHHDMLVVNWCVSALLEARRSTLVRGIRCVLEYISIMSEGGRIWQRFDALFALHFGDALPQRQPWMIPWAGADPYLGLQRCLAIEVDRGTEKLATLMEKAMMYAELTAQCQYQRTLGAPVLPVILAPHDRRAWQIAREWRTGWPDGHGVIAPFGVAYDAIYGALWGRYRHMADPALPLRGLFDDLGLTRDIWQELRMCDTAP